MKKEYEEGKIKSALIIVPRISLGCMHKEDFTKNSGLPFVIYNEVELKERHDKITEPFVVC